jgi:Family of unknown function (DUF5519)
VTDFENLIRTIGRLEGVDVGESMFTGGQALWVNGKEIAHFEDDEVVDIRVTARVIRQRRAELVLNPAVTLRKSSSADWIEVVVSSKADEDLVHDLVVVSIAAHAAPAGTEPKPPPKGAKLERMRRCH